MAPIKMMSSLIARGDGRTVQIAPKQADPFYQSAEHVAWRQHVLARAGYRCEGIDSGLRCSKAAPHHRMFADHIVERSDGGAPFDPDNGQCLCGAHHTKKTAQQRARRAAGRPRC